MKMSNPCVGVLLTALLGVPTLVSSPVLGAESEEGWVSLCDCKSLKGWQRVNGTASYVAVNGAIVGTTRAESPNSFLATSETYRDFVLEFEVKQDGGPANSGVQIRSATRPDYNEGRVFGYQVDIDPSERDWSGGVYDEQRRGWLYPGSLNPFARKLYKFGEWNHYRIEAIGPSIRTWINDMPVAHVIDPVSTEGFIALQIHSIDSPEQAGRRTSWRNIRIRETDESAPPVETLFVRNTIPNDLNPIEKTQGWRLLWDGRTTDGWRGAYRSSFPTRGWKIEEGELILQPGGTGGHIVTDELFSAFELQLEFKLTPGSNSGIMYFVSDRYQATNNTLVGLEYQLLDDSINPEFAAGGVTSTMLASLFGLMPRIKIPTNVGIVPKIGEWQHARVVVHLDNRVEHWLNGIKVLEYVRGSPAYRARVQEEPVFKMMPQFGEDGRGRILLQDHGTEVRYRSIKIRGM
jgi:hypothetical protein